MFLGLQETAPKTKPQGGTKTEKRNNAKTQAPEKERVNFYLPTGLVASLDRIQAKMRQLSRQKITKSEIITTALEQAVAEFDEGRDASQLHKETIARRDAASDE